MYRYWDLPYNNYKYSYTDVAVNEFGFCTLAIDRLGIGNSSSGDPLNEIQLYSEVAALYEISKMLRQGTLPNVPHAFNKIVHVGHSFGSIQSYTLAALHPEVTDGLILTGFSVNGSFIPETFASLDSKLARFNQPLRFGSVSIDAVTKALAMLGTPQVSLAQVEQFLAKSGLTLGEVQSVVQSTDLANFITGIDPSSFPKAANLPSGYLTWVDAGSNQYAFLLPGYFDPNILPYTEMNKFPYTVGELLTIGNAPPAAKTFKGPVQVFTGSKSYYVRARTTSTDNKPDEDLIFCGGNCRATGDPALASIPAGAKAAFPAVKVFEAYIQPNMGHGINVHYNATAAYRVSQRFLVSNGLASS